MRRHPKKYFFAGAALCAGPLIVSLCATETTAINQPQGAGVQIVDLNVFTHRTEIPASFDPASL